MSARGSGQATPPRLRGHAPPAAEGQSESRAAPGATPPREVPALPQRGAFVGAPPGSSWGARALAAHLGPGAPEELQALACMHVACTAAPLSRAPRAPSMVGVG